MTREKGLCVCVCVSVLVLLSFCGLLNSQSSMQFSVLSSSHVNKGYAPFKYKTNVVELSLPAPRH